MNRAYEWGAIKEKAASTGHIPLAIFPDAATGAAALKQLYAEPDYRDKTLAGAIEVYLGNPETRVPGVDDPKKYLERVKERARKLGVSDTLLSKTLAELAAGGAMDAVVEGFGAAEGYENVGVTYTCDGRDKTDDPKIPQTVRNLNLFKSLPDQAPDEVLRLLGCKVPSGPPATVQKKSLNRDLTLDSGFGQNASVAQALGATSSAVPEDLRHAWRRASAMTSVRSASIPMPLPGPLPVRSGRKPTRWANISFSQQGSTLLGHRSASACWRTSCPMSCSRTVSPGLRRKPESAGGSL